MGNYTQAEKLLTESINTLAVTETIAKRYATNIAAAYNYIGEIRLAHGTYREALELFQKAISLCVGKNALASPVLLLYQRRQDRLLSGGPEHGPGILRQGLCPVRPVRLLLAAGLSWTPIWPSPCCARGSTARP